MILVFLFACCIVLYFFLIFPEQISQKRLSPFFGRAFAHRGLHSSHLPENSMAAFRAALEKQYGIELDIRLTADDQIVVFHDASLSRMCGIHENVADLSYAQLSSHFLKSSQEKIPLFQDVLQIIAGTVPLIIEIKHCPRQKILCEKLRPLLLDYSGAYAVESFDPSLLHWFKKHMPQVIRGQLSNRPSQLSSLSRIPAFCASRLLGNVLSRPHFIAFGQGKRNLSLRINQKFGALIVDWVVFKESFHPETQDCIIFEGFLPPPFFQKGR